MRGQQEFRPIEAFYVTEPSSHIEKKSISFTMTIWLYFSSKRASVNTLCASCVYRGEIKVPLINLDPKHTAVFHPGDRIAQLVIQRYVEARFIPAETLPGSDRAERGFGSTGVAS